MNITAGETIEISRGKVMVQSVEENTVSLRIIGDSDAIPGVDPTLSPGNAESTDRFYYEIVRKTEGEIEVDIQISKEEIESFLLDCESNV